MNRYRILHKYDIGPSPRYVEGSMAFYDFSMLCYWLEWEFEKLHGGAETVLSTVDIEIVLSRLYGFKVISEDVWDGTPKARRFSLDLYWNWEKICTRERIATYDFSQFVQPGWLPLLKELPQLVAPIFVQWKADIDEWLERWEADTYNRMIRDGRLAAECGLSREDAIKDARLVLKTNAFKQFVEDYDATTSNGRSEDPM